MPSYPAAFSSSIFGPGQSTERLALHEGEGKPSSFSVPTPLPGFRLSPGSEPLPHPGDGRFQPCQILRSALRVWKRAVLLADVVGPSPSSDLAHHSGKGADGIQSF